MFKKQKRNSIHQKFDVSPPPPGSALRDYTGRLGMGSVVIMREKGDRGVQSCQIFLGTIYQNG
jgi:hypothetical protein